jgi:hypothetical protein
VQKPAMPPEEQDVENIAIAPNANDFSDAMPGMCDVITEF